MIMIGLDVELRDAQFFYSFHFAGIAVISYVCIPFCMPRIPIVPFHSHATGTGIGWIPWDSTDSNARVAFMHPCPCYISIPVPMGHA